MPFPWFSRLGNGVIIVKKKVILEINSQELFNLRSAVFQLMEKIRRQGYGPCEGLIVYTREYHEEIIALYDTLSEP
jgi:hypothetical protein